MNAHSAHFDYHRAWRVAAASLFGVVVLAVAEGIQFFYQQQNYGRSDSYPVVVAHILVPWLLIALLAPAVVLMARVLPLDQGRWWRFPLHLVASACFGMLHFLLLALLYRVTRVDAYYPWLVQWVDLMRQYGFQDFVVYWAIVGAAHAVRYHERAVSREREAATLRVTLGEARLQALRSQLHPHFLFNALNAVAMLVRNGDGTTAVRMLSELGELMRELLHAPRGTRNRLDEEMAFTRRLLSLEQIRFGERLRVLVDVDDEAGSALIPSLLLQPLVENAVRHGIARIAGPGVIEVVAHRTGEMLHIEVRDNGPGVEKGFDATNGIGLTNTRSRLEQLYGPNFALSLERRPEGGSASIIVLPFSTNAMPVVAT